MDPYDDRNAREDRSGPRRRREERPYGQDYERGGYGAPERGPDDRHFYLGGYGPADDYQRSAYGRREREEPRGYHRREYGREEYDRSRPVRRITYTEIWTVPGPHVGRGPKGYERSSERIEEDVCERLTRHGRIDASNIEVSVENGEVTLKGTVGSREEKHLAEDTAESVLGVRDVHNHLTIGKEGEPQQQTTTRAGSKRAGTKTKSTKTKGSGAKSKGGRTAGQAASSGPEAQDQQNGAQGDGSPGEAPPPPGGSTGSET